MAPDKVLRMLADNKPSLSRKSNVTPPKKKKRRERERKEKEKERKRMTSCVILQFIMRNIHLVSAPLLLALNS